MAGPYESRGRHRALALVALLAATVTACVGVRGEYGPAPDNQVAIPGEVAVPDQPEREGAARSPAASDDETLVLVFPYGSEKKAWLTDVTEEYNSAAHESSDGRRVLVEAIPMGSGETMREVLDGRLQAHLVSPASGAFIELANAESRTMTGTDLVADTESIVASPVVIAMWQPMAEALGWGREPIGWSDILEITRNEAGWAAYGYPQWGTFKFGHTHPEYSNSGLISLLAEVYAGAGKVAGLTVDDVSSPEVGDYLAAIEQAVVHYGSSTGFFATRMFENGPGYLSAAVLYESSVIESYDATKHEPPFPVVAVYPKEGTFWSDHPTGVVDREWVTDEYRDAARHYIEYLLAAPQQQKALEYGFRPADVAIPLGAPIDAEHGVNPNEPKTTLEVPTSDVIQAVIELWRDRKKHSQVVVALDVSGSMEEEDKLASALVGARQLVDMLGEDDTFSLLVFNDQLQWTFRGARIGDERDQILGALGSLFPSGGTALYDAIGESFEYLSGARSSDRISAIVVLSDGEDRDSSTSIAELSERIAATGEDVPVRVFTIGYGGAANEEVLTRIADDTQARYFEGTTDNIREVFRDIATFF